MVLWQKGEILAAKHLLFKFVLIHGHLRGLIDPFNPALLDLGMLECSGLSLFSSILSIAMVVSSLLRRSFARWEGWTGDWVMILVDYNMLRVPVNASARQVLRAFGSELNLYHGGAWVPSDCVLSGLPLNTRLFLILEDTDDL